MSALSVFGYGLLFFILFLLASAHPFFVLVFFITIIVVIIHKVKKRKKSKISRPVTLPRDYLSQTRQTLPKQTLPKQTLPKQTLPKQTLPNRVYHKPSKSKIYDNGGKLSSNPPLLNKEDEKITNLINKTKTMNEPECFTRSVESNQNSLDGKEVMQRLVNKILEDNSEKVKELNLTIQKKLIKSTNTVMPNYNEKNNSNSISALVETPEERRKRLIQLTFQNKKSPNCS